MNDLLILDFLPILFLVGVIILVIYLRSNSRRKVLARESAEDHTNGKSRQIFSSTLRKIIDEDDLDKALLAVSDGIRQTFGCDAFIFSSHGDSARLICSASERLDQLSSVLFKYGVRVDINAIPLRGGRARAFKTEYSEFEDSFSLIGDLVTSAACKKIQNELSLGWISTALVKTESGDHAVLLLLPEKLAEAQDAVEQFGALIKLAVHLTNLKTKLFDLEKKFDEQLVKMKNEFVEKEVKHVRLYDDLPIAGAIIDESGIILEANRSMRDLFVGKSEAMGQPFSSIMNEVDRLNFVEVLLNSKDMSENYFSLVISEKYFKGKLLRAKGQEEIVVYLFDETPAVNLRSELERTIVALRKENESAERRISENKKHAEEIVKNSAVPLLALLGDKIEFASSACGEIFSIEDGESLQDFAARNGIASFAASQQTFEASASGGRTFSVSQWQSGEFQYYSFSELTGVKLVEEKLRKSEAESAKLFTSILPTARARGDKIVECNSAFAEILKDFLASDKSLEGFFRYLNESADEIRSELSAKSIAMRTCRTLDRKSMNICFSVGDDSLFIFVEDITEYENLKQQLRSTESLLSNSIESFSEEPIIVLDSGAVSAANLASRNKLNIKLNERLDVESLRARIGISKDDEVVNLAGRFFKIETVNFNASTVIHFREVTDETVQRGEIHELTRRAGLLKDLANSEQYESILANLKELVSDGSRLKLISTGVLYSARETADVYLFTISMNKIEPALSLSLSAVDMSMVERGGTLSAADRPETTFSNIVFAGGAQLMIESTLVGDVRGFAALAFADHSTESPDRNDDLVRQQSPEEISGILKVASSVAVDIQTRSSAQRKFEESGKVTRALVGLTGISDGSFGETSKKAVDLLRQVFGADSLGLYSLEGSSMKLSVVNGTLPDEISIPNMKFGLMLPASKFTSEKSAERQADAISKEGMYFALKSRVQELALMFLFIGIPPAPSELNAVCSIALDLLESKRLAESTASSAAKLSDESQSFNNVITGIVSAANPEEVLKLLEAFLAKKNDGSGVSSATEEPAQTSGKPLEVIRIEDGAFAVYEANFLKFRIGIVKIKTRINSFSEMIVRMALDKIKSFISEELPMAQMESIDLGSRLARAESDLSSLRASVDKVPAVMRNARIEIDGALSRVPFVQGDDKMIQEIKLKLASAAKQLSLDVGGSHMNQDMILKDVRSEVMEHEAFAAKISSFDISALTEFTADPSVAELIKDIFVNFIMMSEVSKARVLMMTAQPSPNEAASGKGKHISVRLMAMDDTSFHEEKIKQNQSMQSLVNKIEKVGYGVDTRSLGNELTMDICEIRKVLTQQGENALLVEDDRAFLEEESQSVLMMFSGLKVASDAVDALRIFESEKFAAAFVDLSLPSINGKELCQQLKRTQPECTTILLTNREGEEKSDGVDHIMLRPITEEALRNLLKK